MNKVQTIDEYLSLFPLEIQEILDSIRRAIKEAAPEAEEKISYQMPAFAQYGILVYFAAFKDHIGFFPTAEGVEAFKEQLKGYKLSKGTIQFPLNKPIPYGLITDIVKHRVLENIHRHQMKS